MTAIAVVFLCALVIGVPVAFALGLSGAVYVVWEGLPIEVLARRMYHVLDSFSLLAVPLFILVGDLSERSGLLDGLLKWLQILVGRLRGGIAYVNVLASMLFAGVSGAAVSDAASLGRVEIEMMRKSGYKLPFSAALTAASSLVGPIIPPSIAMVIFALAAGNISIGGLFLAGAVPGFLLGAGFLAIAWWHTRGREPDQTEFVGFRVLAGVTLRVLPLLALPVIIIGGILSGIFTVTESAAIGVVYVICIGFLVTRRLRLGDLYHSMIYTARMSSVLAMLMGAGGIVSWILTRNRAAHQLSEWLGTVSPEPLVFLALAAVLLLVLGLLMDAVALIVALAPLLAPVAIGYGIDPLHFGLVFVLTTMIGMATPPVGIVLFLISSIAGLSVEALSRAIVPFILWAFVVVAATVAFPELSLWLPQAFGFH